ncbi:MAG: CTP synthase, partial [Clostridia bacterium]|nr:CTP synthase [Clostridia bacterium]
MGLGINPDIIVCRCDEPMDKSVLEKIALFCNVAPDCVIENLTVDVLYEAPLMLEDSKLSEVVCRQLRLDTPKPDMQEWIDMIGRIKSRKEQVSIAIVGKYVKLHDAYLSVAEALRHGGYENSCIVDIKWIESEELIDDEACKSILQDVDGILVPGGFGERGTEGKINACKYARENNIPYFGICLGMQIAVIEYARNVLGYKDATSSEFDPEGKHCVIDLMPDQHGNIPKGGTMRLGAYPCKIAKDSLMQKAYGQDLIQERHRHRYEFNNQYREELEKAGLRVTGTSPDNRLVEAVEVPANDFFIAVQYHPEFKSRPNRAHAIFREFVKASLEHKNK